MVDKEVLRKPDELSRAYLNRYYWNWYAVMTRRPPNSSFRGHCSICDKDGVLGKDLVHQGWARPTNLLCKDCRE